MPNFMHSATSEHLGHIMLQHLQNTCNMHVVMVTVTSTLLYVVLWSKWEDLQHAEHSTASTRQTTDYAIKFQFVFMI